MLTVETLFSSLEVLQALFALLMISKTVQRFVKYQVVSKLFFSMKKKTQLLS